MPFGHAYLHYTCPSHCTPHHNLPSHTRLHTPASCRLLLTFSCSGSTYHLTARAAFCLYVNRTGHTDGLEVMLRTRTCGTCGNALRRLPCCYRGCATVWDLLCRFAPAAVACRLWHTYRCYTFLAGGFRLYLFPHF